MAELKFDATSISKPEQTAFERTGDADQIFPEWEGMRGHFSSLLERVCETDEDIIKHVTLYAAWKTEQYKSGGEKYSDYLQACKERREKIETAKLEWKTAVAQRNEILNQWNTHVSGLKETYNKLRDSPAPHRPRK